MLGRDDGFRMKSMVIIVVIIIGEVHASASS
jgi:hypothetical protein